MESRGEHTLKEILTQADVWRVALEEVFFRKEGIEKFFRDRYFEEVIFIGCGSTHYLAKTSAVLWQEMTGTRALAFPSSELILFPSASLVGGKTVLLVAISRSGETTETLQAVRKFKERGQNGVVAITCYEESSLTKEADLTLISRGGKEKSIAQTRSFASMLVAVMALSVMVAGDTAIWESLKTLPAIGERIISSGKELARELGESSKFQSFFFLGSGQLYGLACEAMLKMKEMSLSYSEAFHFLEFRHGPKSMIEETSLVVGLLSSSARQEELAVLAEMKTLGARVLTIADNTSDECLRASDYTFFFNSSLSSVAVGVLYLPFLQLLAYYKSMAKGLNPDAPRHLESVVRL